MDLKYFIQQNLIWIAGLLIYDLYLNRFNNFKLNRIFLLLILVIGIFIPLIDFNFIFQEVQHYTIQLGSTPIEYNSSQSQESINTNIWSWIGVVYWIEVGLSTFIIVFRFVHLFNLIRFSSKEKLANQIQIINKNIQAPFSLFHYIFLPAGLKVNSESKKIVLSHESAHQSSFHSLDILFLEFSKIFFWYNPLVYMLKKRIQLVHEFEADQLTTEQIAQEQYIDSLFNFNNSIRYSSIVQPFSLQIKNVLL